jgi:hypothetical protein
MNDPFISAMADMTSNQVLILGDNTGELYLLRTQGVYFVKETGMSTSSPP